MTDASALAGTFSDVRLVKGRKVAQLLIEVPIETVSAAIETLGGWPSPGNEQWVAVCRITAEAAKSALHAPPVQPAGGEAPSPPSPPANPKPRQRWEDMKPSIQAGIRHSDAEFREWLFDGGRVVDTTPETAKKWLRRECGDIKSLRDLDQGGAPLAEWQQIDAAFLRWRDAKRVTEQYGEMMR